MHFKIAIQAIVLFPVLVFSQSKISSLTFTHDTVIVAKLQGKDIDRASREIPKIKAVGASTFAVSNYKWFFETWALTGGADRLLVLSKTGKDANASGTVLADALRFTSSKAFTVLIGPCSQNESSEPAVVQMKIKKGKWSGIEQAWVADTAKGRLAPVGTESVTCVDPDEIGG